MVRHIVNLISLKMLGKFYCFLIFFIGYIECSNCSAVIMDFCWRDYTPGYLHEDGLEGAPGLYIGQVNHHGNCPACIYPHSNIAITELYGKMTFTNNIKIQDQFNIYFKERIKELTLILAKMASVFINTKIRKYKEKTPDAGLMSVAKLTILCTSQPSRFYWESVNFHEVSKEQMENAVKGGFLGGSFVNLYVGKVKDGDEWKIGRVMPIDSSIRGLWIWNADNKPVRIYEFDILKYNVTDPKCTTSVHAQK